VSLKSKGAIGVMTNLDLWASSNAISVKERVERYLRLVVDLHTAVGEARRVEMKGEESG